MQGSLRYDDLADVACLANGRAEEFGYGLALFAVLAALVAWRTRDRAAAAGHHGLWAVCALLAGVLHVVTAMFLVPSGCMSGHLFAVLVGTASPWGLAAGLFRGGVPPAPPPLAGTDPRSVDGP